MTVRPIAALLLILAASSCGPAPAAPEGAPGSLVVHMGGSVNSFAGVSSTSR